MVIVIERKAKTGQTIQLNPGAHSFLQYLPAPRPPWRKSYIHCKSLDTPQSSNLKVNLDNYFSAACTWHAHVYRWTAHIHVNMNIALDAYVCVYRDEGMVCMHTGTGNTHVGKYTCMHLLIHIHIHVFI